ncbi:polyphenol oxidase family protein [Desulfovibrio sp. OttesenSCG-928-O18]|nr:polyphenol oxidase family protein [Desulfovibrio sp. OttesenSCG-928-O18]
MALSYAGAGIIPFAFPGLPGIRCAFTTRKTGNLSLYRVSQGDENREETLAARRALAAALGFGEWSELKQVHGDTLIINPRSTSLDEEPALEADGQATDAANLALCVKTADCQPILLAHPKGCVAAVHAGWRGNVLQFPESAVASFCSAYSLDPANVRAVRGPSLGYAEFVNFSREWPPAFAPWYDEKTRCMDLWSLTRRQLERAGLKPGNIYSLDLCTYSLNDLFFSHRKGDTGRQAGIIWREG